MELLELYNSGNVCEEFKRSAQGSVLILSQRNFWQSLAHWSSILTKMSNLCTIQRIAS